MIKLGEISEIKGGKRLPKGCDFVEQETKYKYIRARDIGEGKIKCDELQYIDEKTYETIKNYTVSTNDVCITIVGANIGDIGIVSEELDGANLTENAVKITKLKNYDSSFLLYYLSMDKSKQEMQTLAAGAAQPKLGIYKIKEILVPKVDINIQKKVVNIISKYDYLIENNLKRIKLLEESAELIYKEWFVNFRFPGYEKCEFVDGVPKGWSKVHLSEIVSTQYGFTESALNEDTGVKYLRGKDINKTSYINWSSVPWCKIEDNQKDKYALKKHDILVIRMADPGKVGIVEEDIEAVFASYLIRININNDNIKPYYLFYFLNSDFYQQFISQSSTGATRKSANAKLITDVDILMPEKKVIEQFETKITDLRVLLNNLLQQNEKLKEARDILIPKLIMGEIEV